MKVEYKGSVYTPAGFRSITITAKVEAISPKRVKIKEVLLIDGEQVQANMSRTGAKRQAFYGYGVADREEGKIKNLSVCTVIDN